VFPIEKRLLSEHLARLCVLFEDLRVETSGISADELGRLDEVSPILRSLYFLRRSIATLYEFDRAIRELDELAEFSEVRDQLSPGGLRLWSRAVGYFRKHTSRIARLRNHVGGHFGLEAATHAVKGFATDATSSIEVVTYVNGTKGVRLGFASEVAATALLRNISGHTIEASARKLIRTVVVGYGHAINAVYCITGAYLWNRFGR
jgi:hypothetical protein